MMEEVEEVVIEEVVIKPGECNGLCDFTNGCLVGWCRVCGADDL